MTLTLAIGSGALSLVMGFLLWRETKKRKEYEEKYLIESAKYVIAKLLKDRNAEVIERKEKQIRELETMLPGSTRFDVMFGESEEDPN